MILVKSAIIDSYHQYSTIALCFVHFVLPQVHCDEADYTGCLQTSKCTICKDNSMNGKKKYVKKKERERHLHGIAGVHRWRWKMITKCSFQPALWPLSAEEEDWWRHSAGWKLHLVIIFHRQLCTPAMPGRCRSLSFILTYFLSFYISRFSFYIKWKERENSSGKWQDLQLKEHIHTETWDISAITDTFLDQKRVKRYFTLFWLRKASVIAEISQVSCVCVLSTRDLFTFLVSFPFLSIYWVIHTSVLSFPCRNLQRCHPKYRPS
jgi:hypothetical protein